MNKISFTIVVFLTVSLTSFFTVSCGKSKVDKISAVKNRDSIAGLEVKEITTLVSDSGIVRYRIYTDEWNAYDEANPSYWEFPKGILFERFDETLHIDANFHSDYAKFWDKKKIWEFYRNVKVVNMKGETFETERLFWNQNSKMIYSDTLVTATFSDKIVVGVDFETDEAFVKPRFKKVNGVFALKEENQREAKIIKRKENMNSNRMEKKVSD